MRLVLDKRRDKQDIKLHNKIGLLGRNDLLKAAKKPIIFEPAHCSILNNNIQELKMEGVFP